MYAPIGAAECITISGWIGMIRKALILLGLFFTGAVKTIKDGYTYNMYLKV